MDNFDPTRHPLAVSAEQMGVDLSRCTSDADVVDTVLAHLRHTAAQRFNAQRLAERSRRLERQAGTHWLDQVEHERGAR